MMTHRDISRVVTDVNGKVCLVVTTGDCRPVWRCLDCGMAGVYADLEAVICRAAIAVDVQPDRDGLVIRPVFR